MWSYSDIFSGSDPRYPGVRNRPSQKIEYEGESDSILDFKTLLDFALKTSSPERGFPPPLQELGLSTGESFSGSFFRTHGSGVHNEAQS